MTEDKEQKYMSDMIDAMLAGKDLDPSGESTDEMRKLLAIASRLKDGRSMPDSRFEELLAQRMTELKVATSDPDT
ncbi:MAG: hypothetical protein WC828_07835, partial [Thermoleophilia bacterium]